VPTPPAPAAPALQPSRRALLTGGGAAAGLMLVGCTPGPGEGRRGRGARRRDDAAASTPSPPEVDPDVAVATEALAAMSSVLAWAERVGERHPGLAVRLAGLLAAHRAHTDVLDDAVPQDAGPTASASPSRLSPSPDLGEPLPTVPPTPGRALERVVVEERALATAFKQLAFRARSGPFARLLGSIAASAAQHAAALSGEAR
jgi:hypothetical protein